MRLKRSGLYAMNGKRYLLDTNAVIALLAGNNQVVKLLCDADWIGISVITRLEFLAFSRLSDADRDLFSQFVQRVDVIGLGVSDDGLLERIVAIRLQHRLKLPDAIVVATAMVAMADLVSADAQLKGVPGVLVHAFAP
jgi:tRNA(fMet)-specific endonuclease VapC